MTNWTEFFQVSTVVTFLLVLFRVIGVFFVAPLLGNKSVPASFQISFSIVLSFLLLPFIKMDTSNLLSSDVYLIKCVIQEVTIGVLIGFAASILFSAIQCAGEILGIKIGFSIATIIDPSNNGSSGIVGSLYIIIGALIFLYLNGHHVIIKSLTDSFFFLPLGDGINIAGSIGLANLLGKILIIAVKIAAPVMIVVTLLNLIFGFITKLSPQMNIYFNIGFIVSPVLGITTLMLSLPLFRMMMAGLTSDMGPDLIRLVKDLKGI